MAKLKLVVPTNFSKKSEMALDFALHYSQKFSADVYVFHVLEEKGTDFRKADRVNVEYMDRMKQAVIQAVDRLHAKGGEHTVEDVHRRISQGKPAHEILQLAGGVSADMIIMGAPSAKNLKDLFYSAPCTVVLVRDKDTDDTVG